MNNATRKQKRPPEGVNGTYSAVPTLLMDSVAFMGSSHAAKSILFELLRQLNGRNNGHLQLSYSWLKNRGWKSRDVIQRARNQLLERSLIILTRQGGFNIGASQYAVTWLKITNFVGLDIQQKNYHPGAYGKLNPLPMSKKITNTVPSNGTGSTATQYSTVPLYGTAKSTTVP